MCTVFSGANNLLRLYVSSWDNPLPNNQSYNQKYLQWNDSVVYMTCQPCIGDAGERCWDSEITGAALPKRLKYVYSNDMDGGEF